MKSKKKVSQCAICGKAATRLVDGEPSCDQHAQLLYENQLEDYTKEHLSGDQWLETVGAKPAKGAGRK